MRHSTGFTLVELLVSLIVGSVISMGIYASFQMVKGQYEQLTAKATMSETGRAVLGILERDLRMAGYTHRGADGAFQLGAMSQDPFTIASDKNGFSVVYDYVDPVTDSVTRQEVTYSLVSYDRPEGYGERFRLYRELDKLDADPGSIALTYSSAPMADFVEDFFIIQGDDDVSNSLVGCYGFNGELVDTVAGQNPTANGTVSYPAGVADRSVQLNGAVTLTIPHSSNLAFDGDFAVAMFIKPDNFSIANRATIIRKGDGDYALYLNDQFELYGEQYPSDGSALITLSSDSAIPAGQFTHVALVREDSVLRIYVNGSQWSQTITYPGRITSDDIFVGAGSGAYTNFEGAIDDLRFYDQALSAGEIASLASNAYLDCTGGNSSLINLSLVIRSKEEHGNERSFEKKSYFAGSISYSPAADRYYREQFNTAVLPRNL